MNEVFKYPGKKAKLSGVLISCILSIIIIFNACGYQILFNRAQNDIRREIRTRIREGLKENELTLIELTDGNIEAIRWIKTDKEFSLRGNLYDVVKTTEKDGRKFLYCINDTKEKKLIADYSKKTEAGQKTKKLINAINLSFLPGNGMASAMNLFQDFTYSRQCFDIRKKVLEIADPPPWSVIPS